MTMANLYFCQPHSRNQGTLRAVLSLEECKILIAPQSAAYVGDQFPAALLGLDADKDYAVLRVDKDEADSVWRSGFHRLDGDLMELNGRLITLAK